MVGLGLLSPILPLAVVVRLSPLPGLRDLGGGRCVAYRGCPHAIAPPPPARRDGHITPALPALFLGRWLPLARRCWDDRGTRLAAMTRVRVACMVGDGIMLWG